MKSQFCSKLKILFKVLILIKIIFGLKRFNTRWILFFKIGSLHCCLTKIVFVKKIQNHIKNRKASSIQLTLYVTVMQQKTYNYFFKGFVIFLCLSTYSWFHPYTKTINWFFHHLMVSQPVNYCAHHWLISAIQRQNFYS